VFNTVDALEHAGKRCHPAMRIRLWPKIKMPSRRNLGSSRGMQVDSLPCTATGSPVSPPATAKIVLQL
jgi:hypothetical protein